MGETNEINETNGLPEQADHEDIRCPRCCGRNVNPITDWTAISNEDELEDQITEYQCVDCNSRSFWI